MYEYPLESIHCLSVVLLHPRPSQKMRQFSNEQSNVYRFSRVLAFGWRYLGRDFFFF